MPHEANSPWVVASTAHHSLTDAPLPAGQAPHPDMVAGSILQLRKVPQRPASEAL